MKLIDIIIGSLCAIGLVYFFFDRRKYSNINVYREKQERLNDLKKIIATIESNKRKTDEIIKSINADTCYDEELMNKLVDYRDNEEKLNVLKTEQKEIEKYIKNASMYNKKLGL